MHVLYFQTALSDSACLPAQWGLWGPSAANQTRHHLVPIAYSDATTALSTHGGPGMLVLPNRAVLV